MDEDGQVTRRFSHWHSIGTGQTSVKIGVSLPKHLVVQTDKVREPRVRSFLVVPLTSRLHLEGLPGNVRLDRRDTGLPKPSVASVYDAQKVLRPDFRERLRALPAERLAEVADGLRLVLDLC